MVGKTALIVTVFIRAWCCRRRRDQACTWSADEGSTHTKVHSKCRTSGSTSGISSSYGTKAVFPPA
jgi:hypothetical protein